MDTSKIKAIIVAVLALLFAVYLGVASATESTKAVLLMGSMLGVTTLLIMGRNVWVLIPIFTVCEGYLSILPGSPDPWILAGAVVTAMYLMRFLARREGFVWRWSLLDLAVLLQLLCVLQVWVRNPTGLMLMGGDEGGAKTYLVFIAAVFSYACLSITSPTIGAVKFATILRVCVGLLDGIVIMLQGWLPSIATLGLRTYTSPIFGQVSLGNEIHIDETRLSGAKYLGINLLTPAFCLVRPLRCLIPIYIIPFLATVVGAGMLLLSGFRSTVGYFVFLFLMAAFYRRKPMDAVIAGVLGALGMILVIASGQVDKLPFGVQRILTVVGANVKSQRVHDSAENSADDRFLIWRTVLTQKGYISNKWLGDGFALSKAEYEALVNNQLGFARVSFIDRCLTTGNYHGFHVSTIKYTGVLGLTIAIFLMGTAFATALKLIRYSRNTELFPYVLYVCLPVMIYLPWSLLVFGAYKTEFPRIIIMAGMIKLLENLIRQRQKEAPPEGQKQNLQSNLPS